MGHNIKILCALLVISTIVFLGCKSPWVSSAIIYLDQQNNPDKALEQLQKALEQNPNNPEVYYIMGRAYLKKGMYKEMVDAFDHSLALAPTYKIDIDEKREGVWSELYSNQGVKNLRDQKYEEVIQSMELAALVLPTKWETYNVTAVAYDALGKLDSSDAMYTRAIAMHSEPKNFELYCRLAYIQLREKKYQESNDNATLVINGTTDDSLRQDAVEVSARALSFLGRTQEALTMFDQMIKAHPNDADAYYDRGVLHMEIKDTANAIVDFQKVMELDPKDLDVLKRLGLIFLDGGSYIDYEKALEYYQRARELIPDEQGSPGDRYNIARGIGKALANLGRPEEAAPYLTEAKELWDELHKKP